MWLADLDRDTTCDEFDIPFRRFFLPFFVYMSSALNEKVCSVWIKIHEATIISNLFNLHKWSESIAAMSKKKDFEEQLLEASEWWFLLNLFDKSCYLFTSKSHEVDEEKGKKTSNKRCIWWLCVYQFSFSIIVSQ